jgi:hypothetical protein
MSGIASRILAGSTPASMSRMTTAFFSGSRK